ncbi:YwdI family protein [Neobacillus dielmonensis]|uniref:YwdI family protein n=1 Tax=Neobacillus dielmonensis TaxID=1347369 RepID=UPI0005A938A8|nr:YwdI family protein [Neobacillus dielmonensis]
MNISVQKLLAKIEEELKQAQTSQKEESLREKIYSIKILCELILDEKSASGAKPFPPAPAVQPAANYQPFQQPAALNQPKKIDMDEANGDSLFDF